MDSLENIVFEGEYHNEFAYFSSPRIIGDFKLYQIGRAYCKGVTVVEKHLQLDFFELTVVTSGKGTVITNDERVPVKQGDIYVSFPGDFHSIESDRHEPLRYDFLAIQTGNERMRADLDAIVSRFGAAGERIIKNEDISLIIANAIAELGAEQEYSEVILEAFMTQVLSYLIRAFKSVNPIKYPKSIGDAEVLCYQIMHYIDSHIYSMKHLSELCEVTNYNYNYLSNVFKRVTSDTLSNYFRNRRLQAARVLLTEHSMSVTQIAALLNYSSVYIFSRAFKEHFGVPPSEIDKLEQSEKNT